MRTEDSCPYASSTAQATSRLKGLCEPCLWARVHLGLQGEQACPVTFMPSADGKTPAGGLVGPTGFGTGTPQKPPSPHLLPPASQERAQISGLPGRGL